MAESSKIKMDRYWRKHPDLATLSVILPKTLIREFRTRVAELQVTQSEYLVSILSTEFETESLQVTDVSIPVSKSSKALEIIAEGEKVSRKLIKLYGDVETAYAAIPNLDGYEFPANKIQQCTTNHGRALANVRNALYTLLKKERKASTSA